MKIFILRHGQTDLNSAHLMQGLADYPLNDTGIRQAKQVRDRIKDVKFDAVFASPLIRAVETASLVADISKESIIIDKRIIETDFGKYDMKNYYTMGLPMKLYWAMPEVFKAPRGVETIEKMVERASSFLKEVETSSFENVLIVAHGGIIRALYGYLEDKKNHIRWRPKPKNCELSVFESINGQHKLLDRFHQ